MTHPTTTPGNDWNLSVSQVHDSEGLVVTITGRLSAAQAPRLAEVLAAAVSAGNRRIILDLHGLDYISSAGIMSMEAAAGRLRSGGGALILRNLTPPVRLALHLSGFPDDVPVI